jgi:hypothetical protein
MTGAAPPNRSTSSHRSNGCPPAPGGYSQRALELAIVNAFKAKGVEVFVFFHPGVDATRVTYRVGHTTIGPYSVARAARGISAAVEAFHMHVPIN